MQLNIENILMITIRYLEMNQIIAYQPIMSWYAIKQIN